MKKYSIFIFACCLCAAACGGKANNAVNSSGTTNTTAPAKTDAPTTAATAVNFADACKPENDKKIVEISGYLDGDEGVFCSETVVGGGEYDCAYRLKENSTDKKGVKANIKQGNSANQSEKLAAGYERKDIKIHAADGSIINIADKVKLTGEMSVSGSSCAINVAKIEK